MAIANRQAAPVGKAASAVVRGVSGAGGATLVASGALLLFLVVRNPFFVDSLPLALLAFLVVPGVVGAIVGLIVGALGVLGALRRPPRQASSWPRALFFLGLAVVVVASLIGRLASARAERGPAHPSVQLMIVGVDGATWDVAGPMLNRGELPTLASLVEGGAAGVLESLEPMYSPRIFTTIATGKHADKHGVRTFREITSDAVVVKRLWDILRDQLGWDYGIAEWYVTWPPSASPRGFAVPGLLAQNYDTIPPQLSFIKKLRAQKSREELRTAGFYLGILAEGVTNGLRISTVRDLLGLALMRAREEPVQVQHRAQQQAIVRVVSDAACYELTRRPVEVLALIYKSTDSVSHRYWQYREPSAFPHVTPEEVERFGGTIEETYAIVDREIARLRRFLSPGGIIAVVSDHGFQARRWLIHGFYGFRTKALLEAMGFTSAEVSYVNVGDKSIFQPVTLDQRESARIRGEVASAFRSARIEGYAESPFEVTNIDREGTGDDYVEVRITELLTEASDAGASLVTSDGTSIPITEFLRAQDVFGAHATNGIIVLAGKPFRAGSSPEGASVLDVTPTLLAALGLPVADDMDGRPLVEVMSREHLSRAPVTTTETYETEARVRRNVPKDDAIPEDVAERLRALGYIE